MKARYASPQGGGLRLLPAPEGGQLVLSLALAGVCDHQRVNAYNREVLQRLRPELVAFVDGSATSIEHLQGWLATSEELLEREPEANKLKQAFHDGDNECEDLLYVTSADAQPGRLTISRTRC